MLRPELIKKLQESGVDVSRIPVTEEQRDGVEQLSPAGAQLMEAVKHQQQESPVYMPFEGGTPTQRRREADTAAEQWDQKFERDAEWWEAEFERDAEWWDKEYGLKRDQYELDKEYRNAQIEDLQRAVEASKEGGALGQYQGLLDMATTPTHEKEILHEIGVNEVRNWSDHVISDGGSWNDIKSIIESNRVNLSPFGLSYGEALQVALESYESHVNNMVANWPIRIGGNLLERHKAQTERVEEHAKHMKELEKARKEVTEILLKEPLRQAELDKTVDRYQTRFQPDIEKMFGDVPGASINLP